MFCQNRAPPFGFPLHMAIDLAHRLVLGRVGRPGLGAVHVWRGADQHFGLPNVGRVLCSLLLGKPFLVGFQEDKRDHFGGPPKPIGQPPFWGRPLILKVPFLGLFYGETRQNTSILRVCKKKKKKKKKHAGLLIQSEVTGSDLWSFPPWVDF